KATCPKCGELRSYGTAGILNLVKTHLDTQKCQTAARKRDRQPRGNTSLAAFFTKSVPRFLSSTVRAPSLIGRDGPSSEPRANPTETVLQSPVPEAIPSLAAAPSRLVQLLDQLHQKVELLPSTVPLATSLNPLSEFSHDPEGYVAD
ncbi:hypothetical protein B0H15DRAFT_737549, partial [Mycena belliarum]